VVGDEYELGKTLKNMITSWIACQINYLLNKTIINVIFRKIIYLPSKNKIKAKFHEMPLQTLIREPP